MSDYLVRATGAGGRVRVLAARATALVDEARRRHDLSVTATAALGRALTAAALLGALLKGRQTVTLRVVGGGPLRGLVAESDASGHVRGYAGNGAVELPVRPDGKLDVRGAVGSTGYLYVTRDLRLKEPYIGSCPLVSGEIAEDLATYFLRSEQTPAAVGLGVLVGRGGRVLGAGGYILQLLPESATGAANATGAADTTLAASLEKNVRELGAISRWVAQDVTPEDIARRLLGGLGLDILARQPLAFTCRCSPEKVDELVVALGRDELDDAVAKGEGIELRCRFCGRYYRYDAAELARITAAVKAAEPRRHEPPRRP